MLLKNGCDVTVRDTILTFDGSFEGFLCLIHAFYYDKLKPSGIVCENQYQQRLGAEYRKVETDYNKAETVANGIRKKISINCYDTLYTAFLNESDDKFMDLFNYCVLGFKAGRDVDKFEKFDFVLKTHDYAQRVIGESHLFKGFVRFKKTAENILYARIEPKNNVLPMLIEHFVTRLPDEKWIIHDAGRQLAAIYDAEEAAIYETPAFIEVSNSNDEDYFQNMWRVFNSEISVMGRVSRNRQRNMLPLRYRSNMTEF